MGEEGLFLPLLRVSLFCSCCIDRAEKEENREGEEENFIETLGMELETDFLQRTRASQSSW